MNVYVVGPAKYYAKFMSDVTLVDDISEAQVVLFTGGEDVDPAIYGRRKVTQVYTNIDRDYEEKDIFNIIRPDQLAVGICRGSQFLCVMNGGNLVQHCTKHALHSTHPIYSLDNKMMYEITSTHHQMQYPFDIPSQNYEILFYATQNPDICVGDGVDAFLLYNCEPEVVLYKIPNKPKCLAIQGHPEMMPNSPVAKMLDKLIKSYVK